MPSLTFSLNILCLIVATVVVGTNAANNTTQFDNFTIEWEDFSILTCAIPTSFNLSLFTCPMRNGSIQVQDISCLTEVTIDFDQNICQPTTIGATSVAWTSMSTQTTTRTTTTSTTSATTTTTTTTTTTAGSSGSSSSGSSSSFTSTSSSSSSTTTTTQTMTSTSTTTTQTTTTTTSTSSLLSSLIHSTNLPNIISTDDRTVGSTVISSASITSMISATTGSMPMTTRMLTTTTTSASAIYDCLSGYIGIYCNISSDACAMSQPCQNAATCFPNNTLPLGYYCVCRTGYAGYNCEWDVRPCREDTCWNNGTCVPVNSTISGNNGSNFLCLCSTGYNGLYCELKINLCDTITCENRGVCQMHNMEWQCHCLDATYYYGDHCQYKTNQLRVREIISKSFASVAIGAIVTTCSIVILMDILKYVFHIDPAEFDRDSYRRRRERQKRARRPLKSMGPKIALRFQYIS